MARFRSNKRAKELQRKAKHEAKEARKRERQERSASGEVDADCLAPVDVVVDFAGRRAFLAFALPGLLGLVLRLAL